MFCWDISDVCCPAAIGKCLDKLTLKNVFVAMSCLFGAGISPSAANPCKRVHLPHNARNCLEINMNMAVLFDPCLNTTASICVIVFPLAGSYLLHKPAVLIRFMLLLSPCVIPAARDLQNGTHCRNRIFLSQTFYDTIFEPHRLPASDRKFRSTSVRIRNSIHSFLRAVNSSASFRKGLPFLRRM